LKGKVRKNTAFNEWKILSGPGELPSEWIAKKIILITCHSGLLHGESKTIRYILIKKRADDSEIFPTK
jgi:hypothetical protein